MLEKILAFLHISHPVNGISAVIAVFLGYWGTVIFYQVPFDFYTLLLGVLACYSISSSGFVINDILDIEIDRINRPSRPLPAAKLSIREAWIIYCFFSLVGLLLAWLISVEVFGLSLFIVIVLLVYSLFAKKIFFLGHFFVALAGCFSLIYGGLMVGEVFPTIYTIPAFFLAFVGREILKTIPDIEGDKLFGVRNIATLFGQRLAAQIASLFFVLAFIAYVLLSMIFNPLFVAYMLLIPFPLILFMLWRIVHIEDVYRTIFLSKMIFLAVAISIPIGSIHI